MPSRNGIGEPPAVGPGAAGAGVGAASVAAMLAVASSAAAVPTLNQVNDFQNGQASGWGNGGGAADPVVVSTGGPTGTGDRFLRVTATGSGNAGSRLVTFNT